MNPTMVRQLAYAQLAALRAQAERDRTARAARRARRTPQPDRRHPAPRRGAAILRLARRGNPAGNDRSPAQKTAATTAPNQTGTPAPGLE